MVSKIQLCEQDNLESLLDSLKTPSDFQTAGESKDGGWVWVCMWVGWGGEDVNNFTSAQSQIVSKLDSIVNTTIWNLC